MAGVSSMPNYQDEVVGEKDESDKVAATEDGKIRTKTTK